MGSRVCAEGRGGAKLVDSTAFVIVLVLVLGVLVGPSAAGAQAKERLPRVGVIWEVSTTTTPLAMAFRQGLVSGRPIVMS
jgi:hypothetical protein